MSEHEAIRELLVLAVAGALDADEQRRVEQHLAGCAACAAELDAWHDLTGALKRLPTPQPPAALVERTRARAEWQLAAAAERRWNHTVLVFLVLFAWTVTLVSWPIVRLVSGGMLGWLDVRMNQTWVSLAGYTALGWLTVGVAALMLGLRHRSARRAA